MFTVNEKLIADKAVTSADVLYIDFNNPPQSADDSELTDDDIVIRYNETEPIMGLTVLITSPR